MKTAATGPVLPVVVTEPGESDQVQGTQFKALSVEGEVSGCENSSKSGARWVG